MQDLHSKLRLRLHFKWFSYHVRVDEEMLDRVAYEDKEKTFGHNLLSSTGIENVFHDIFLRVSVIVNILEMRKLRLLETK